MSNLEVTAQLSFFAVGWILLLAGVAKLVLLPASLRGVAGVDLPEPIMRALSAIAMTLELGLGGALVLGVTDLWVVIGACLLLVALGGVGLVAAWTDEAPTPCACLGGAGDLLVSRWLTLLTMGLGSAAALIGLAAAPVGSLPMRDFVVLESGGFVLAYIYWVVHYLSSVRRRVDVALTGLASS